MKKGLSYMVNAGHDFERVDKEASCLSHWGGMYAERMYVK